MKLIALFCYFMIILNSCSVEREFKFIDPPSNANPLSQIEEIDPNDYQVFLREVCTSDNKAKTTYQECPRGAAIEQFNKIELEYLFVSRKSDTIIYITNFPDKDEYIYNTAGYQFKDKVFVNVWYLSKIYFGKIDRCSGTITFQKNSKKSIVIGYDQTMSDRIKFQFIYDIEKKDTVRREMSALLPMPGFYEYPAFEWMFAQYDVNGKPVHTAVGIANNSLLIIHRSKICFELTDKWGDHKEKWIRYKYNRLATRIF